MAIISAVPTVDVIKPMINALVKKRWLSLVSLATSRVINCCKPKAATVWKL